MMLYPNIVEARRGRRSIKTITIPPHHRVITCLCCFAVYLLFSHKYFRIRICEVCSLVKILLVTFCKLSARCWLLCARQSAALKFAKSMFSLHTARVWAWPAATASTGLHQPSHTSWDKEAMESSSSSSSRAAQHHLQLLPQFLHYKCTNYYRAAEGSVTSRCVVCSVTGSSGVTQLLAAVWCQCQCSLESLCPARRLLQLHRGRSVAREEALDTGACGFHIR